jgi:hypothetical protein
VDEESIQSIEEKGVDVFLDGIRSDLVTGRYRPSLETEWRNATTAPEFYQ